MKFLFVRSSKLWSKIIRWGLSSDCSHFAVCFDEEAKGSGIIFHSTFSGTKLEWFGEFKKHHTIMHAITFKSPLTLPEEENLYLHMLAKYSGQKYDFYAFLFWTWRCLLHKLFKLPFPKKNYWAMQSMNLCTALASGVDVIEEKAKEKQIDLEMIAPHKLYELLLEIDAFTEVSLQKS